MPVGAGTCVTMEPNRSHRSFDDMIRELGNGIVLRAGSRDRASMDPSFGNGLFVPGLCYEVRQGRVARRILDVGIQFSSKKLWHGVTDVGDANTMQPFTGTQWYGQPPTAVTHQVMSPAVQLTGVSAVDVAVIRS